MHSGTIQREAAPALGWRLERANAPKTLKQGQHARIAQARSGEKRYLVEAFPLLSKAETAFVVEVLSEHQRAGTPKHDVSSTLLMQCHAQNILLEPDQADYLAHILSTQVTGFGPVSLLLEDTELEEVALPHPSHPVYVYHAAFGWLKTNLCFEQEQDVIDTVNRMLQGIERRLCLQTPRVTGVLPDGTRLHAAMPPVAHNGPTFTLRLFQGKKRTPLDLIRGRTLGRDACAFLWLALQSECSLLVAGNTGSGKTTTLNALLGFVPPLERIVLVEETPEILPPQAHVVTLRTSSAAEVDMESLVLDTLRMRPDRVVVGEVRSKEEVAAFADTLLAGQGRGSYATFHAQSAREAITRLEEHGVGGMDLAALDLLLVQRRWATPDPNGAWREKRRVTELCEILPEHGRARLSCLYRYQPSRDALVKVRESSRVKENICRTFAVKGRGYTSLLVRAKKRLAGWRTKKPSLPALCKWSAKREGKP